MTDEQKAACEKLEKIKTQEVHDKFTDKEYEQNTRISWFQIGLKTGFQAAQTPEMLMLNPLVEDLISRLKISTMYLDEMGNWGDTIIGNNEALAPFKEGE